MLASALAVPLLMVASGVGAQVGSGQALLRCQVRDNGHAARGELRAPSGTSASCAEGLVLPAGRHAVRVRLQGSVAGAHAVRHVSLEAGEEARLEVAFETGELVLWALEGDAPAAASADLWHDGQVRAHLEHGRAARVGIGSYVVDARAGNRTRRFHAVHVNPGGRTVLVWQTER